MPTAGVIVLGGSEGGLEAARRIAQALARDGYPALAVAYFAADGLPDALDQIPLEYFKRAIDWMRAQPEVDPRRIVMAGGSKGAEAALLVASTYAEVSAVVAGVPSHVVWQDVDLLDGRARSSWTFEGRPLPFVRYAGVPSKTLVELYATSLRRNKAAGRATIPVERIRGPILLVSGGLDTIWPSRAMAAAIVERLRARRFEFCVSHYTYAKAGHGVWGVPMEPGDARAGRLRRLGGTAKNNVAARADFWPRMLSFLGSVASSRRAPACGRRTTNRARERRRQRAEGPAGRRKHGC